VHTDHEIFERGIAQSRKIRLTFGSEQLGREVVSLCAPLYYSRGRDETNELECYYMWDFEATVGYNFAALLPSEIVSMELTDDCFELEEIHDSSRRIGGAKNAER
jgi:hypothetical protein